MTVEGNFKWDLDIPNMKLDELDALIAACYRARKDIIRLNLIERFDQLVDEAKENGCYFETIARSGELVGLTIPNQVCLKDYPQPQLEV